jgi:alkaline phosphatase
MLLVLVMASSCAKEQRAKNIILFIGDAAGMATVNAASIYGYNEPRKLFVQNMPHIALAETSAADEWVTDSAASATAIVTGRKTRNGVLSQSSAAVRGEKDGEILKTILEYAEENGLSTGVVTNSEATSATPAACYAHVNDRKKTGEIAAQILKPGFGDGIDVLIGTGRKEILTATRQLGIDFESELTKRGQIVPSLESIPADASRLAVLLDNEDFDLSWATREAIRVLSRNGKGYFLMVESDCHTEEIPRGLRRMVDLDRLIRDTAQRVGDDTLIIFAADHSYDFRVFDGKKNSPLFPESEDMGSLEDQDSVRLQNVRRDDDHTGEEVLVAAQGPGAHRIRGVLSNTELFKIMLSAFGWHERQ